MKKNNFINKWLDENQDPEIAAKVKAEAEQKYKAMKQDSIKAESINVPTYVGGYRLGNDTYHTQFNFTHKPNWFHRTMMRLCFGWEWVNL